jgi:hypothetical protein
MHPINGQPRINVNAQTKLSDSLLLCIPAKSAQSKRKGEEMLAAP